MSDDQQDPGKKPYKVGYGKPPKASQFKPGQSGFKGRRKRKAPEVIDIDAILDRLVTVSQNGKPVSMEPRKLALLAQIGKARGGSLPALVHVLDQFARFDVLGTPRERQRGGVLAVPSTMPFPMGRIMAERFGRPPWSAAQLAKGRAHYLEIRSDDQAREDQAIGYPDL